MANLTPVGGVLFLLAPEQAKPSKSSICFGSEFQLQIAGRCNTACRLEHSGLSPCFARSARPAPTPFTSVLETSRRAGDWLLGKRVPHPQTCSSNRAPARVDLLEWGSVLPRSGTGTAERG